jgi:WhiB family redox-sensing transcriptional regulator
MKEKQVNEIYSEGLCTSSGKSEMFFSESPTDLAAAQSLCGDCDVRIRCLEYALENAIEWGVWGGVIFWDGQAFYRKRGRGRPKLSEVNLPLEATFEELEDLVRSA